jgi:hypothetical protein
MAMVLGSVENEQWFFYLVLHEEQIEQLTHNTFGFGCAHVCTKFLQFAKLPICCYNQSMESKENLKGKIVLFGNTNPNF